MTTWWSDVLANVPASAAARLAHGDHADRIARELAAARARWPGATITDEDLAAALAAAIASQRDLEAALPRLRIEDLFLARWCASGAPSAIAAFEVAYRADVDAVLARFRRLAMPADELRQTLRIKLFVGTQDRPPRIAEYSGFGFLQNWLRVTALRALVDVARSERARKLEELLADDELVGVPDLGPALDARYSRAEVSAAIKRAFARAVASLAPRQRNFLRHAHVDGLSLDQTAALYGIHRATVARTLAQARAAIVTETRRLLAEQLGVDADALDSVVRAADSRLELSLSRVLRDSAPGSDEDPA